MGSQTVGHDNNNNIRSAAGDPQDNTCWESSNNPQWQGPAGSSTLRWRVALPPGCPGLWLQASHAGRGRQVAYADKSCPQAEGSPVSGGRSQLSFCSLICYQLCNAGRPAECELQISHTYAHARVDNPCLICSIFIKSYCCLSEVHVSPVSCILSCGH